MKGRKYSRNWMLLTYSYAILVISYTISSIKQSLQGRSADRKSFPSHVPWYGIAFRFGTRRIIQAWHAVFVCCEISKKPLRNPLWQISWAFVWNPTVLTGDNRKVATKRASSGLELRRKLSMLKDNLNGTRSSRYSYLLAGQHPEVYNPRARCGMVRSQGRLKTLQMTFDIKSEIQPAVAVPPNGWAPRHRTDRDSLKLALHVAPSSWKKYLLSLDKKKNQCSIAMVFKLLISMGALWRNMIFFGTPVKQKYFWGTEVKHKYTHKLYLQIIAQYKR